MLFTKFAAASAALFCLLTPAHAAESAQPAVRTKPVVAVSIVPQQTFVKAVGGDLVDVVTMVPPGASPENFEPTPDRIAKFSTADIYFSIGVPVEKNNILPIAAKKTKVVDLQKIVAATYPDRKMDGERDPHIWLSPKRAVIIINTIADELSAFDPAHKAAYAANAAAYIKEIQAADENMKKALSHVKNKKFMVYHPAFGYFADEYGLTMFALEHEGKEATPQHMQHLLDIAKKDGIKVVFYQAEIDSRQAEAFAEEVHGKTIQLEPLSADFIPNLKKMATIMAEYMK